MSSRLIAMAAALLIAQAAAVNADDLAPLPLAEIRLVSTAASLQPVNSTPAVRGTTLGALLTSVEMHAPQVVQAQASAEAAAARETVAAAPFDPVLGARYDSRMTGFYGGQVGDVQVRQRLQGLNATVYGGYSLSRGRLPVYEDEYLTNRGGEFRAGASFALLRGRNIDPERAGLNNARLATQAAQQKAALRVLDIKSSAMSAYVQWLYAEHTRLVYDELYTIAQIRDSAIEKAIAAGQLASITKEENRQLLLARQSQKIRAEQMAVQAAVALAIYLRDETGQPMQPVFGAGAELPQQNPFRRLTIEEASRRTLEARPDFTALSLDIEQLKTSLRLAENDLQPNLDLKYEVRRDFGDGSPTRAGTDHKVGLTFNLPIEFSKARGTRSELSAKIKAARAELRLLRDGVGLSLQANQAGLQATEQQLDIGRSEVLVAQSLQAAEEARYLAGASDVFRLNAQETALANSKLRVLDAQRNHDLLLVEFFAVTGELWF